MENKKKMAFNVVFLILVFAGTIYGVFHGEDLGEIARILKTVNLLWLIPGFICVIVFIWGESIIIYYMMRTLGIKRKKWTCFLFSSVGFFFSCITPSASGGQPAQIYYMKKEKIPIPVSTLVLMIVTITYKLVLVVIGVVVTFFGQGFIHKYLYDVRYVFYLGTGLNVFCVLSTRHHISSLSASPKLRGKKKHSLLQTLFLSTMFSTSDKKWYRHLPIKF